MKTPEETIFDPFSRKIGFDAQRHHQLRQDPLDLSFWSFLTFLHRGIEEIERHLL